MKILNPENFEIEVLNDIIGILNSKVLTIRGNEKICDMTDLEKRFLNGIIRQNKPKKILELGVSAGGSSLIILNAIKDFDNSKLYSIDYSDKWYLDGNRNSGFIIQEKFPHIYNNYKTKEELQNQFKDIYDIDNYEDSFNVILISRIEGRKNQKYLIEEFIKFKRRK